MLIDWYLPGTKAGGPVRSVYSLLSLLKNDFDFYLITGNCDLGSDSPYDDITSNTLFKIEDINYYYFDLKTLDSKNMLMLLNTIAPDLIYLNSFWSFNFSINIVKLKFNRLIKAPVLLAPRGMLGKGALGLKSLKKQTYIFLTKQLGWYKSILFHATQQQEESDIHLKFRSAKIFIAPNINALPATQNKSLKTVNHLKLFFLSRISRVKNLHFALEILKSIPPDYTIDYDIFGNIESQDYWNECKKIIDILPKHVKVNYQRELQFNEVQQTIGNYHFLFMPTLNENFGHSIVESLLCGCPAIISDQTPWTDLEINQAGFAISLNNTPAFVEAIVNSAQLNQEQFKKTSNEATVYIRKKIDLELVHHQYKKLFNEIIKN